MVLEVLVVVGRPLTLREADLVSKSKKGDPDYDVVYEDFVKPVRYKEGKNVELVFEGRC